MSYKIGDGGESFRYFQEWLNRKFASYSHLKIDLKYGLDEAKVIAEANRRYGLDIEKTVLTIKLNGVDTRVEGAIATDEFLARANFHLPATTNKWLIQGVGGDSRAFLNPPDAHSYQKATDQFSIEGNRLMFTLPGPVIPIGYSMGGESVAKFLNTLSPQQQNQIKLVLTFGDPCMPDTGSLFGDSPGGGISALSQPDWCRSRYYSFAIDGDWYPQATGLLPFLYQVLSRAELSIDFALWLFTSFPLLAMQELMGQKQSTDPLAGVLTPLAGLLTTGPMGVIGQLFGPAQILALLPQVIELLFSAIKFMATNAHGQYGNPAYSLWDGMTGVDKAVQLCKQYAPDGATLLLFPGTWANWDQGFPFDVAIRLAG